MTSCIRLIPWVLMAICFAFASLATKTGRAPGLAREASAAKAAGPLEAPVPIGVVVPDRTHLPASVETASVAHDPPVAVDTADLTTLRFAPQSPAECEEAPLWVLHMREEEKRALEFLRKGDRDGARSTLEWICATTGEGEELTQMQRVAAVILKALSKRP